MSQSTHNEVVALTGSIGSGKSTVGAMLRELGATVVDADVLARQAVAPGSEGLRRVAEWFGPGVLRSDGSLDRKKLGALIFADPEQRAKLEEITHPIVRQLSEEEFQRAKDEGAQLIVYECPLLFEAGLDEMGFRQIVVVAADKDAALERIAARDGITREEAAQRQSSQLPIEEKRRKADVILDNSSTISSLRSQVEVLYKGLTKPS